ncbi:hypothetical protein [Cognatishimia sp.]|uniref:hypothetical protein n=1 Tax=Cognatishimia sp. TaxID=2211648 RepID=UPI0035175D39|nr:hypothetical protein [Cognatishimia sp.]
MLNIDDIESKISRDKKQSLQRDHSKKKNEALRSKHGHDIKFFNNNNFSLQKGQELGVIILDKDIKESFYSQEEHKITPRRNGLLSFKDTFYHACFGKDCPLCEPGSRPGYEVGKVGTTVGLTVLPVVFSLSKEGKLASLDLAPIYTKDDGEKVYHKQLLRFHETDLSNENSNITRLVKLLKSGYEEKGTIRGMLLKLKRGTGDLAARVGKLTHLYEDGDSFVMRKWVKESILEKLGKKMQPTPRMKYKNIGKNGEDEFIEDGELTSDLVKVHDHNWAVSPLNCYREMTNKLTKDEAKRMFSVNFVASLVDDENSFEEEDVSIGDFEDDGEDEVSLEENVSLEDEAVATKEEETLDKDISLEEEEAVPPKPKGSRKKSLKKGVDKKAVEAEEKLNSGLEDSEDSDFEGFEDA